MRSRPDQVSGTTATSVRRIDGTSPPFSPLPVFRRRVIHQIPPDVKRLGPQGAAGTSFAIHARATVHPVTVRWMRPVGAPLRGALGAVPVTACLNRPELLSVCRGARDERRRRRSDPVRALVAKKRRSRWLERRRPGRCTQSFLGRGSPEPSVGEAALLSREAAL